MPKLTKEDFRKAVPKWKLVHHLERALAEFDEAWEFRYEPKKGDLGWHPSGDCTPVPSVLYESAYLRLNDIAPEGPGFSKKNGMVGHFWHQYLQHVLVHKVGFASADAIERKGIRCWGAPGTPFHFAIGSADVAPCVIPQHGEYVVDFKTMNSQSFRQMELPVEFAKKYECQIQIYMDFFGIEKGLIVAINKDSPHDMKEFEYRLSPELVEAIYDKWAFVADCLNHNDRPTDLDDRAYGLPFEVL